MNEHINALFSKNNKLACDELHYLMGQSIQTNENYQYMDIFSEMLHDESNKICLRGALLICANARWDIDNKIDRVIDELLMHVEDEKPTSSRQFIKSLGNVILHKKELIPTIKEKLENVDFSKYKESMSTLLTRDVQLLLKYIDEESI